MTTVQTDNLPAGVLRITTHRVWVADERPKPRGRPKGAKDTKKRKTPVRTPGRRA